jgi:hypothetical protein
MYLFGTQIRWPTEHGFPSNNARTVEHKLSPILHDTKTDENEIPKVRQYSTFSLTESDCLRILVSIKDHGKVSAFRKTERGKFEAR